MLKNAPKIFVIATCFGMLMQAQQGQPTTADRESLTRHATLYGIYRGDPVEKCKPNANNEIDLSAGFIIDNAESPSLDPNPALQQLLAPLATLSALVIRATALSFQSKFTPDRSFLFSDWKFKITDVIKNGEHQYFALGEVITVTRTGGLLIWNGVRVTAHDLNFPAFSTGGDYVLYLFPIPEEPRSFEANYWGSFQVSNDKVRYLNDPGNKNDPLDAKVANTTAADFLKAAQESAR